MRAKSRPSVFLCNGIKLVCSDNERELGKTERGEHENQEGDEVIKCLTFVVHMLVIHRWYLFPFLLIFFYVVVIVLYRQRMGQCLNDLSFQDLQSLESDMESAWRVIHDRAVRYSAQLTAFLGF